MPEIATPGTYVEELPPVPRVEGVQTDVVAFVGTGGKGLTGMPLEVASWAEFEGMFGGPVPGCGLPYAVRDFFANGGRRAVVVRVEGTGVPTAEQLAGAADGVLPTLEDATRPPALLAVPPPQGGDVSPEAVAAAHEWCLAHRAVLLVDAPSSWAMAADVPQDPAADLGVSGPNAAVYWPRLRQPDPLHAGRLRTGSVVGAVAGVIARTDRQRGIWTAPAGPEAEVVATGLGATVTDGDQGVLNPRGVNCLREFPGRGVVVWGARTLSRDPEWRYLPVRRLALFVESSLDRGLGWATFEPNRESTWTRVRSACERFLTELWRRGAFPGRFPSEGFFVRCGRDTMTPSDIAAGRLVVLLGLAPQRPGEFTVVRLQLQLS